MTVLLHQKIMIAVYIIMMHVGFILFEWGLSRKKNADSSIKKHMYLLATSAIITFFIGFAFAYGDPHLIGTRYYVSILIINHQSHNQQTEQICLNYLLLMLSMALVPSIAVSSINERQNVSA